MFNCASVVTPAVWLSDSKTARVNLLVIGLLWIAMAALVNPLGDFPLNDDWVYALAVRSVLDTGYYQFPSPSSANVGPQIYWGALFCLPFGFSFTALRFSSLAIGLIGVLTLYGLIREIGGDHKTALLGALTLAVNPLYFGLANTFMTDAPFISVVIAALYFFVKGLKHSSRSDIALGLAFSFAAILIRQVGLILLLGFAVAYLNKKGYGLANFAKATIPILFGALLHVAYQYWLLNTGRTPLLSGHSSIQNLIIPSMMVVGKQLIFTFMYVGFFVLPFVAALLTFKPSGTTTKRRKGIWVGLIALAISLFGVLWWNDGVMPLSENILVSSGLGPLTLRDTFNLQLNFPSIPESVNTFWKVITVLSVLAACTAIYYLGLATQQAYSEFRQSKSRSRTWLYVLLTGTAAAYLAILLAVSGSFPVFDRYLLLFLPIVILIIATIKFEERLPVSAARVIFSVAFIIFYAGFSVAATHDYLAWNRTRWVASHDLINEGKVRPNQIDGGYEFNGWYLYDAKYKTKPEKSGWWVDDDEYTITSGPLPGYFEVKKYPFTRWLLGSESNVYVLRRIPKNE